MNTPNLNSREDYIDLLRKIIEPTIKYFDIHQSSVYLPEYYATSYDDKTQGLETFSRLLWGIVHLDEKTIEKKTIIRMIIKGVDEQSDSYWGALSDYSQSIVETFPILLFLINNKDLFDSLSNNEKEKLCIWFSRVNSIKASENNWQFFIVLANLGLKHLGLPFSKKAMCASMDSIEKMYLGNGWYSDGQTNQIDYYIPFAMHFYSLIIYKLIDDIEIKSKIKERAVAFSESFINWFDKNGSAVPYGRSLTYKFAQVAFWAAMVYSDIMPEKNDIFKGLINRNLRWWIEKDIFNSEGLINIGYAYANHTFSEYYNGTGSSYWCLKAFIFLFLPADNAFFSVEEQELPQLGKKVHIPESKMVVCRYEGVPTIFVNGQYSVNKFGHTEAKYEKFVYSSLFGFCISKSYLNLELLSADSTLAISFNGKDYAARHDCSYDNDEEKQTSLWKPQDGTIIKSIVFPGAPEHIRIHLIKTSSHIELVDHGFAVKKEQSSGNCTHGEAVAQNRFQFSKIKSLFGNGEPIIIENVPNTNVMYSKTVIPAIKWVLEPGMYVVCNQVVGSTKCVDEKKYSVRLSKDYIMINDKKVDLDIRYKEPYSLIRYLKNIKKWVKK